MGLFDYVIAPFNCPYCKYEEKEHDWQTKSLLSLLKTYRVGENLTIENFESSLLIKEGCFEIHTVCRKCNKHVSAMIEVKDSKITEKINYRE
ncbi:MAG: hypothetical protein QXX38_03105 [Candidatus Aenigmatarchaeota archaeon]